MGLHDTGSFRDLFVVESNLGMANWSMTINSGSIMTSYSALKFLPVVQQIWRKKLDGWYTEDNHFWITLGEKKMAS